MSIHICILRTGQKRSYAVAIGGMTVYERRCETEEEHILALREIDALLQQVNDV